MIRRSLVIIGLLIAMVCSSSANAEVPSIRCTPKVVYCGDTLTVYLKNGHAGADFAVALAYGDELRMLSFRPSPKDKIPPVIPADQFAKMKRVELRTDTARGSPSDGWQGNCVPRVKGPPEPIFTVTGDYQVMVGYYLWRKGSDFEFGNCEVEYIDHPRPKQGEQYWEQPICHPNAEAEVRRKDEEVARETPFAPLKCEPQVLYKGDTLTVDIPTPRDDYEFGIERGVEHPETASSPLLMSFKPGAPDKIAPVIPFDRFRSTKQLRIITSEARGSPASTMPRSPCFAHVDRAPELVFTRRGDYGVEIGPMLGGLEPDVAGYCVVHYIDRPRPSAGSNDLEW
jgi:hypothetical protein